MASANSSSFTLLSSSTTSTWRALEPFAQRAEQRGVGLGVVERLALRVDHRHAPQRHEEAHRTGGRGELARRSAAPAPRISSGVVRISVTDGLCT